MLDLTYELNGKIRERGYLLGDGIYPDWSCFVKTISHPSNAKEQYFAKTQESLRKDVERASGLLTNVWKITKQPCRLWDVSTMTSVMHACIILQNMRIEYTSENGIEDGNIYPAAQLNENVSKTFAEYCADRTKIKNAVESVALRKELMDHLWNFRGEQH